MVRHFPVPVHVNGHKARQVPFLTNPETAICWEGLRVDVIKGRPGLFGKSRMSFHGAVSVLPLTVTAGRGWANIEVVHCPRLRMIRPGFRTISDNRFAQDLLVWLEAELR